MSAEKLEFAEKLMAQHSKLLMNATSLAELLDVTIPDLPSLQQLEEDEMENSANVNPNSDVSLYLRM